jgi:hypothetical protein
LILAVIWLISNGLGVKSFMFDVNSPIEISMRTATGKVPVSVRWPSDEEWIQHHKKRKIFLRQLGRGATETELETGEADLKLYETIRIDGAPPLTLGEASKIVKAISTVDVLNVDLGAAEAVVTLRILTGDVKHTVKIPTMDQVREFQRATHVINLPYNRQEIRASLDAGARLWDKCGGQTEGYENGVPNIHKDEVIRAVISEVEQELASGYDDSNF